MKTNQKYSEDCKDSKVNINYPNVNINYSTIKQI